MAQQDRTKISEYSATASENINIGAPADDIRLGEYGVGPDGEATRPEDVNNAIRELMSQLKDMDTGTEALTSPDFTAFKIGAVDVTATAAELNQLDGTTITSFAKTILDDTTADAVRTTIDAEKNRLPIKADEAIVKGAPVYATGTVGASGKITVSKFIADSSIEEIYLIGVADRDLAVNDEGFAISFGELVNMQTDGQDATLSASETWVDGQVLYASADTAGFLTKTAPTSPNQAIPVAIVVYSHASSGILFVRPSIGSHIGELHDVLLSGSEADGSILVYDGAKFVDESGATARASLGLTIGTDVQAYDANTAKYDDTTANFTGTLQNGGSNVIVDGDYTDGTYLVGTATPGTYIQVTDNSSNWNTAYGWGNHSTAGYQAVLSEGAFVDGDKTKLDGAASTGKAIAMAIVFG